MKRSCNKIKSGAGRRGTAPQGFVDLASRATRVGHPVLQNDHARRLFGNFLPTCSCRAITPTPRLGGFSPGCRSGVGYRHGRSRGSWVHLPDVPRARPTIFEFGSFGRPSEPCGCVDARCIAIYENFVRGCGGGDVAKGMSLWPR